MRVSTMQYHKRNITSINNANTELLKQHDQLSTGKKVQRPSDDPVASSRIKLLEDRAARSERYNKNAVFADNALLGDDTNMKIITDIVSTLNELQIRSGNGIYSKQDRETFGLEAQQLLDQLVSMANSTDANGKYMYSGSKSNNQAVTLDETTQEYVYNGDNSVTMMNISAGLQVQTNDTGLEIFMDISHSDGDFVPTNGFNAAVGQPEYAYRNIGLANHTNTGDGAIETGGVRVTDRAQYLQNIDNYFIKFDNADPTKYDVYNSTGNTVVNGATYTPNQPLKFKGIEVFIDSTTTPDVNNVYRIAPTPKESIFKTVQNMVTNLNRPNTTADEKKIIEDENAYILHQLGTVINHVTNQRTILGGRLQSIERAQTSNDDLLLGSIATISLLEDANISEAAIKLTASKNALQATQQSFAMVQQLSLFNYI